MWGQSGEPGGYDDPVSLSRKLRGLAKGKRNPDAYTLIPVHVWTHNVSDVVQAQSFLGNIGFDVVTPEMFMQQLSENVFHDCPSAGKATGSFTESCSGGDDKCGVLRGVVCGSKSGSVENSFFDHTQVKLAALFAPILKYFAVPEFQGWKL